MIIVHSTFSCKIYLNLNTYRQVEDMMIPFGCVCLNFAFTSFFLEVADCLINVHPLATCIVIFCSWMQKFFP